jgi:putative aminopeptidase FrvX
MSVKYIQELVQIPSPSGYTHKIVNYLAEHLKDLPYLKKMTQKGAFIVSTSAQPERLIAAHIDTLGGMVKWINPDGSLEITQIGGWPPNSFEGEYVTLLTQDEREFRGTFMLKNPAAHVNRRIPQTERVMENMQIRLDAIVRSSVETCNLGISVGDYVFFDPRFEFTATGFVKSRFLDDKACAGILYDLLLNEYEKIVIVHPVRESCQFLKIIRTIKT